LGRWQLALGYLLAPLSPYSPKGWLGSNTVQKKGKTYQEDKAELAARVFIKEKGMVWQCWGLECFIIRYPYLTLWHVCSFHFGWLGRRKARKKVVFLGCV